jgi:6-phosphogluconolactonase
VTITRNIFETRESLAVGLADAVSRALAHITREKGRATLAVSGGTTPSLFFAELSKTSLDWKAITITLVDERQVGEDSPRSNAALLRKALLQNQALTARFVPLYKTEADAAALDLDVVVLGMGNDGHTASFFPGGDHLAAALDMNTQAPILEMNAPGAGEPRLTFTLRKLLAAANLFLHIEGAEKHKVLQAAEAGADPMQMPIRAVLASNHPISLYWCP